MIPLPCLITSLVLLGCVLYLTAVRSNAASAIHYVDREPVSVPRVIRAIKAVEGWRGQAVGKAGERGPMQMRKPVWDVYHQNEPAYINKLMQECAALPRLATPYMIALVHTAGFTAVKSGCVGSAKRDFAERVANVYEDDKQP